MDPWAEIDIPYEVTFRQQWAYSLRSLRTFLKKVSLVKRQKRRTAKKPEIKIEKKEYEIQSAREGRAGRVRTDRPHVHFPQWPVVP